MVFPLDINTRVNNKRKIAAGENLHQLVTTVFIVGNVVAFFTANWAVSAFFGGGLGASLLLLLALNIVVGVLVFRFIIFEESEKVKEYKSHESDSFSRRMNVRSDVQHFVTVDGQKVMVAEFADGSASCVFEFKFGSNDNVRAEGTRELMRRMMHTALTYNFEARVCCMPENFENSDEFRGYMRLINSIVESNLKEAMVQIAENTLSISVQKSNVDVVYFTIRSLSAYQRAEIEAVIQNIFATIRESHNAIRSVKVLDLEGLLSFYREFYGIAAIDLSSMKTENTFLETRESLREVASVYRLISSDGAAYSSTEDINAFSLREIGKDD